MTATVDLGCDADSGVLPYIEGAHPFGAIELMRRNGKQIKVVPGDIDGKLSGGLRRVGVKRDPALAADCANFSKGLQNAGFVVRGHHRHQDCVVAQGAAEAFEIEQAVTLDGQQSYLKSPLLKVLAGIEHGFVLGDDGDDVTSALA